ncbi:MAG: hypothetical protein RIR51_2076 [Bacteroidota bacterium]
MKERIEDFRLILEKRKSDGLLRTMEIHNHGVDFTSNDYLSLIETASIQSKLKEINQDYSYGSSGSRLLSGNHPIHEKFEELAAKFHHSESGLLFNSGYAANIGVIQALCNKEDYILSDELNHASIIDGISLSKANKIIFKHNDLEDLNEKLKSTPPGKKIWIIIEALYSMDGDHAPLKEIVEISKKFDAAIILDEAHSGGVYGPNGEGLAVELNIEKEIFVRIITFGKAWGNHGAIALTNHIVKSFLINFSRSLIYSTSLSPKSVQSLLFTLELLPKLRENRKKLFDNIAFFKSNIQKKYWLKSNSSIQSYICPGNENVRKKAEIAQKNGFIVKPIVYPTVPKGMERIRICLKANHDKKDLKNLITQLENEI